MNTTRLFGSVCLAVLVVAFVASCGREPDVAKEGDAADHHHEHHAPHDGTAVVLGEEEFHLEFVLDPATGTLSAYVLDGEMENFIRVPAPSFEVVATIGGTDHILVFNAVGDGATGERVGDTSLFQVSAEWLKEVPEFDAILTGLSIRGANFTAVPFNFPRGNEKNDHPHDE